MRRVFGNLYFLTFLNGFLLASIFYFKMEANYEKEIFQAIQSDIRSTIKPGDSQDSAAGKIMHACHYLMVNRESVFEGKQFQGIKAALIDPTSFDLMTGNGACGSYSMVLARILQGFKFSVRIAQMKAKGIFAEHNIVEAKTDHGWVVLDPLYDTYFVGPSGLLASFEEVKNNWNYYKSQVPPDYDMNYHYEDVRYTNWTKIPVVLPAVKKILDLTLGKEKADGLSIRTFFLRKYEICYYTFLVILFFSFSYTLVEMIRVKIFPQKNIPVTFSNIYKYIRLRLFGQHLAEQRQS
jgi:hypothetical protein